MRLAAIHGPRYAIIRPSVRLVDSVGRSQSRTINTKPRHERPPPITEQIDLRLQPNPRAHSIGILGGGITALAAAWHLSRLVPDAKITVYEKQHRFGGWVDSETVDTGEGEVLFEWGCRSLRPDAAGTGRATLTLLSQLQLLDDIIGISKKSPAARNRFIYYGGRLVQMPGPNPSIPPFYNAMRNLYKVLTEPIFKGIPGSIFAEYWVQPRPTNMADESVGDFIRRRFGQAAADNLASAFFHGIYAGDIYKLSARTLLPALWHMETRDPEGAGILMEMTDIAFKGQGLLQYKYGRYADLCEAASEEDERVSNQFMQQIQHDTSVYTFGHGLRWLSDRLQERLTKNPHLTLKSGAGVTNLKFNPDSKKIAVVTSGQAEPLEHDYVVSSLSAKELLGFTQGNAAARGSADGTDMEKALQNSDKSVNVAVVNLYYSNPNLIPSGQRGFGYLIPRTVDLEQNPERALGVIFGSETSGVRGKDAVQRMPNPVKAFQAMVDQSQDLDKDEGGLQPGQLDKDSRTKETESARSVRDPSEQTDEIEVRLGQDTAPGTKLTVMLGGHWWDGWSAEDLPSEEQCIEMAKSLLARHLKIMEVPLVAKARVHRDCLPQYHVGYRQRMATIHRGLMDEFQGRLKVAGPWWQGGVGVNDCILSAHLTAFNIREGWDDETGLKEYTEREKWLICDRRTRTFAVDPVR